MYRLINDRRPRNPQVKRYEVRIYKNWTDVRRAMAHFRRLGIHATDFLEVNGPAIQLMERV